MGKSNRMVNEAPLKARRTSLGKKSNEELINIILRKDKSERSMNSKIQELTTNIKNANAAKVRLDDEVSSLKSRIEGYTDLIKVKQTDNDNLRAELHNLAKEKDLLEAKYSNVKRISFIRKRFSFSLIAIITILIGFVLYLISIR